MIGRTISHYRILEKLGEGGMGVVYKAHDLHLDHFVAVKFLHEGCVADDERRRRFAVEAKAASALSHPKLWRRENLYDTAHTVPRTPEMIREVLDWLDRYLGSVD